VAIHSYTLMSEQFAITCRAPGYEAFLCEGNLGPAYTWQKRFLQLSHPTKKRILKSPEHVYGLEHLLAVFPDATVIQTHRNPLDVLRSSIDLTEVLQEVFAYAGDREQSRIREARSLTESMERITSFRETHPELEARFIGVKYHELVSDPLAIVCQIYRRLDLRLPETTAERMRQFASRRSRYKGRGDGSTRPDPGLGGAFDRHRFEAYCSRFDVPVGDHYLWPDL
jgi:hypothetical protein